MDRYKKEFMSGVDVSKRELNDLKEAFKKEKFKELFKEYVEEVNDPKNQALYEKELLQLEKQRGADSTFLRPSPGYVIKTSVEGDCEAFVNVCYNEKIERPQCEQVVKNGQAGSNWSVPHVFSKGRMEMTKDGVEMLVYDVLFHPMALDLAHRNPQFKELVNSTALSAVEDGDRVKLDRRNARIDKQKFVGGKFPCLVRRKAKQDDRSEEVWELAGYPYPKLEKDPEPSIKELQEQVGEKEGYTTPVHAIKERKGIDLSEFRLAKDAKMLAAIPEELVVEIRLPLIDSASDVNLKVVRKSLSLTSETPAKYKLHVVLPYEVDDGNGKAKFDKDKKILTVNLPVLRRKYEHQELQREDSGIDSDITSRDYRSSSEEELRPISEILEDGHGDKNDNSPLPSTPVNERQSEEVKDKLFLNPSRAYSLPQSTVTLRSDTCFLVVHVKNIDPESVVHQFWSSSGVWIKFSSFGAGSGGGMFPSYYTFCFQTPRPVDRRTLRIEVWDNNMICSVRLQQPETSHSSATKASESTNYKCMVGLNPNDLSEAKVIQETDDISENEHEDSDDEDDEAMRSQQQCGVEALADHVNNRFKLESIPSVDDDVFSDCSELKTNGSSLEDGTSDARAHLGREPSINTIKGAEKSKACKKDSKENGKTGLQKARTLSESSIPVQRTGKRSILKCSRSLSECNTDESFGVEWSSQDSNDSPDDHSGGKKTVRFSDVVSEKIFRANSSILGQRKKNERKAKNRKRAAAERRASESEPDTEGETSDGFSLSETSQSDVSDVSAESSDDNSATPSTPALESKKHHRRRGSKNRRKNAATVKQNYVLRDDLF